MKKLETLKSNMVLYSATLDTLKLSEFLIDEIAELSDFLKKNTILSKEIKDKEDLKSLKLFIVKNKEALINGIYEYSLEEIKELNDNLNFRNSQDGKLILEIEDWVLKMRRVHAIVIEKLELFVTRSLTEPTKLLIGGIVKNENVLNKVVDFFEKQSPPVLVNYKLEIE